MVDPRIALAVAAGTLLLLAIVCWPEAGLYARWHKLASARQRVWIEDALKHLYHCEACRLTPTLESVSGSLAISRNQAAELVARLEKLELLRIEGTRWELTPEGRRDALRVIRVHRLYERYLADHTSLDERHWHEEADRREHLLSHDDIERLAATMNHPSFDPHGAPIPTESGELPPTVGEPLSTLEAGDEAMITRVEDEPTAVYAQLVAQGVIIGARVRVIEKTAARLRLEIDGDEQVLAPMVAGTVLAVKLPETVADASADAGGTARLSDLPMGAKAQVVGIAAACRGLQRRRLLDLGLVPGTVVEAELTSIGGDPTAYRIRGALIALRRGQAEQIQVRA